MTDMATYALILTAIGASASALGTIFTGVAMTNLRVLPWDRDPKDSRALRRKIKNWQRASFWMSLVGAVVLAVAAVFAVIAVTSS